MKKTNFQSGFTTIHVILLLVIFGVIGFAGWKVYDTGKSSKPIESATATPVIKTEDYKIPEGFVEYKNEELGFKFAYPKEWGEVVVEKIEGFYSSRSYFEFDAAKSPDGVNRIDLRFSGNKEIFSSLRSLNYVGPPRADFFGAVASFCKTSEEFFFSFPELVKDGEYDKAGRKEVCASERITEKHSAIGNNALLVSNFCTSEGCFDTTDSILVIKTDISEFPGLKFLDLNSQSVELLKKIPATFVKI